MKTIKFYRSSNLLDYISGLNIKFGEYDYYTRDNHNYLISLLNNDSIINLATLQGNQKTFTGYKFVNWLCRLFQVAKDARDYKFLKTLGEFLVILIQTRANRYFDEDYPSIFDFFKSLSNFKFKLENKDHKKLSKIYIMNYQDKKKHIGVTQTDIIIYDRGTDKFLNKYDWYWRKNDINVFKLKAQLFKVVQNADVNIPSLKRRLINLINYISETLRVERSNILNAGYGLFSTKAIPRGNVITYYGGNVTIGNPSAGLPLLQQSKYVVEFNQTIVIRNEKMHYYMDGERGFYTIQCGRWANGSNDGGNAEFDENLVVISTRNINPGEEIIINYGSEFFEKPLIDQLWMYINNENMKHPNLEYETQKSVNALLTSIDIPKDAVFVDVGSHFGTVVFHSALLKLCKRYIGFYADKKSLIEAETRRLELVVKFSEFSNIEFDHADISDVWIDGDGPIIIFSVNHRLLSKVNNGILDFIRNHKNRKIWWITSYSERALGFGPVEQLDYTLVFGGANLTEDEVDKILLANQSGNYTSDELIEIENYNQNETDVINDMLFKEVVTTMIEYTMYMYKNDQAIETRKKRSKIGLSEIISKLRQNCNIK